MTPEDKSRNFPDWALRERQRDMAWIRDNLDVFWAAASGAYELGGRGAVAVDARQWPSAGRPPDQIAFGYFTQANVDKRDDEDVKRMVREYDPAQELVLVLLKSNDRLSSYRIQVRPREGD